MILLKTGTLWEEIKFDGNSINKNPKTLNLFLYVLQDTEAEVLLRKDLEYI